MTAGLARFMCRASPEIGGGHVVRCHALAQQLESLGWKVWFHVNPEAVGSTRKIRNNDCVTADPVGDCNVLVIDDYSIDMDQERNLRKVAQTLVVIDDLDDRDHDCDVLIDPTPYREMDSYKDRVIPGSKVLSGPGYALLRPEFVNAISGVRIRDRINRVLVSMGRTDPSNFTPVALEAIKQAMPNVKIDVVLGSTAPFLASVKASLPRNAGLHVDVDASTMVRLMMDADFAIGAPGGTGWERCAMGLPSIVVTVAGNQQANAEGLARSESAHVIGDPGSASVMHLAARLKAFHQDNAAVSMMSRNAMNVCDGRGAMRAAIAMMPAIGHSNESDVQLRLVEHSDAKLLYEWRQDPETRRFARNPAIPRWEEHLEWLDNRLADPSCIFCLTCRDGDEVGFIRLDREGSGYEISIATAPEYRGLGFGRAALRLARNIVPNSNILACVKPENRASRRMFHAMGYEHDHDNYLIQQPSGCVN